MCHANNSERALLRIKPYNSLKLPHIIEQLIKDLNSIKCYNNQIKHKGNLQVEGNTLENKCFHYATNTF